MPELSNLLRQKLGEAQKGAETHPDADTLTALTERLLPAAERQQVMVHLAACGECREIVALSQPQLPELVSQAVVKPAPVSGWRRLFTPTFGLAGAAAVMAIVALVVSQNQQKSLQQQPSPEAKVTQPADSTTKTQANAATPSQPEAVQPALDKVETSPSLVSREATPARPAAGPGALKDRQTAIATLALSESQVRSDALRGRATTSAPVLTADLRKKDYVNTGIIFAASSTDSFSNNGNMLPVAPQPQPSAEEARLTATAPPQITIFQDIPTNTASNKSNVRIMTPPAPPERFTCPMCKVVEKGARAAWRRLPGSVPAINGNALSFSAMGGQGKYSGQLQKEQPAELAAAPAKPTGVDGLQRFEGLSSRSMAGAESSTADSSAIVWKVMGGKLVKSTGVAQWEEAYPGASFQFSVVSTRGNEVWAGGTHASIIHSRDGGATWEVPKLGDDASGSVVSILFSGSIVQVRTSEGQSWSSSDGGKTWAQN
jgi:hypothetical protein